MSAADVLELEMPLPGTPEEVWPFFADAHNLQAITPPWLRFNVLSPRAQEIVEGTLIDYRLRWRGVPIRWRTRIAAWDPPHRFIDEQLRGPYRVWRHTHTFEARGSATLMRDRVEYSAPLSWISHPLIVRRDVREIFEYRRRVLLDRFGRVG
jgi:ligand-binding SRPBCC domain-containing protein